MATQFSALSSAGVVFGSMAAMLYIRRTSQHKAPTTAQEKLEDIAMEYKVTAAIPHCILTCTTPQLRAGLVAIASGGVFNTSEAHGIAALIPTLGVAESDRALGPVWGAAHFLFAGITMYALSEAISDMAKGRRRMRQSTAWLLSGAGVCMGLVVPSSGYWALASLGPAVLACSDRTLSRIGRISQWAIALIKLPLLLLLPRLREGCARIAERGVWGSGEVSGMAGAVPGADALLRMPAHHHAGSALGPAWGAAHFIGCCGVGYALGCCMEDMAHGRRKMRASAAWVLVGAGVLMGAVMPTSGHWGLAVLGARVLMAETPGAAATEEKEKDQ